MRWEFYGCLRWKLYVYGIILLTGSKTWMLDSCFTMKAGQLIEMNAGHLFEMGAG